MTLQLMLGGLEHNVSRHITVSGGFTKDSKHLEHRVAVGNVSKSFVRSKIIEWDSFKSVYFTNGKLDPKYYDKFLEVVNSIILLPIHTMDDKELAFLIKSVYEADTKDIINGFIKTTNMYKSVKQSVRHLFMIYKMHLESLIETYVNLRSEHVGSDKLSEPQNFTKLVNRWNAVDDANDINTSSPILFFNFPPKSAKLDKSIPRIEWGIKGAPKDVQDKIKAFRAKSKNFAYIGYCQNVYIRRFQLLLEFPVAELVEMIKAIDTDNKHDINEKCSTVIKDIHDLSKKIDALNNQRNQPKKEKKRKPLPAFPKEKKKEEKIKVFTKYIDAFIGLYKDIVPQLNKHEKYINDVAVGMNIVAEKIKAFCKVYQTLHHHNSLLEVRGHSASLFEPAPLYPSKWCPVAE